MADIEIAPFRPFPDFLFESARFQAPDVKDLQRWSNRVINNLLYYQTNYFLVTFAVFAIVGILHPTQMMIGIFAVVTAFGMFIYITNNKYEYKKLKQQHPLLCVLMILASCYMVLYFAGSVLVFLFGIALPVLFIIIHASLRMRNIKNKLAAKIEFVGLKRTPMGLILEGIGQEQEAGS